MTLLHYNNDILVVDKGVHVVNILGCEITDVVVFISSWLSGPIISPQFDCFDSVDKILVENILDWNCESVNCDRWTVFLVDWERFCHTKSLSRSNWPYKKFRWFSGKSWVKILNSSGFVGQIVETTVSDVVVVITGSSTILTSTDSNPFSWNFFERIQTNTDPLFHQETH